MAIEYVTAYQISRSDQNWPFALVGLLPIAAALVIFVGKRRFKWQRPMWLVPIMLCAFGFLWLGSAGISVFTQNSEALAAYQRGDFGIVEGEVTDFYPMPYEGHQEECFSVQIRRFCYSDYMLTPGFRNAASHGGPIRSGLPVRIAYRDGIILRLEIAKDQALTPAQIQAAKDAGEKQWDRRMQSDPVQQRMMTAFLFTAVAMTLWWNLQWRRVMRFWLKPPNRPLTQSLFRAFFAANLIGAIAQLLRQLHAHPVTSQDVRSTLTATAVMCAVVGVMSNIVLWNAERRTRS